MRKYIFLSRIFFLLVAAGGILALVGIDIRYWHIIMGGSNCGDKYFLVGANVTLAASIGYLTIASLFFKALGLG